MKYKIGGRAFEQRRLVWGQFLQVRAFFKTLRPAAADATGDLIDFIGPHLPRFAAIVLREEGTPLPEKDLDALTAHIEDNLDATTGAKVVTDFLSCNPIASDLSELASLSAAIRALLPKQETTSKTSSAPLPEGTSPEGTPSSGGSPRKSPVPTSSTESGS